MSMTTLSPTEAGPRTRGKRDAVRDFETVLPVDVGALIENAQERYKASHGGTQKYWLAYWGRLIELRREAYQRRHRPGRWAV